MDRHSRAADLFRRFDSRDGEYEHIRVLDGDNLVYEVRPPRRQSVANVLQNRPLGCYSFPSSTTANTFHEV